MAEDLWVSRGHLTGSSQAAADADAALEEEEEEEDDDDDEGEPTGKWALEK